MERDERALDLRIPPDPHLARVVRLAVAEFAAVAGVERPELERVLTALGEALANAFEHAKTREPIDVRCVLTPHRITVAVRDHGVGFDADRTNVGLPVDPRAERGRGLAIMRRCADSFTMHSRHGSGTVVVFACGFDGGEAAIAV